ncbi:NUDIX domain-containing protein [Paenibacillus cremeus]|nr:NUDIX domain-containing protein [Paenibacillus cremeus]
MEIIKNDLHCNAVRISGQEISRLTTAAEFAIAKQTARFLKRIGGKRLIRTTGRAFLIQDSNLLAVRYKDKDKVYYALPGGGQEKFESLHSNLQREYQEELGIDIQIGELLFVREWIDKEQNIHQIEFIFKCSPLVKVLKLESEIPDGNQIGIEWLPLMDIMSYHIYPLEMREHLHTLIQRNTKVPIYLGEGK